MTRTWWIGVGVGAGFMLVAGVLVQAKVIDGMTAVALAGLGGTIAGKVLEQPASARRQDPPDQPPGPPAMGSA